MNTSEQRQSLNKKLNEFISKSSSEFMELSKELKPLPQAETSLKSIDKIFKQLLEFNRGFSKDINELLEEVQKIESLLSVVRDEKRKLEILYSSGILFFSETEMKQLMEKAIDVVVTELKADEGFIVFVNEKGEIDTIVTKNMEYEESHSAKELSTSVIRNTIEALKPVQINDIKHEEQFSAKSSVISLDLTAALCVPLISNSKVIGAVYLDRRKVDNPFTQNDLKFLISFAKQIVKGMEVSLEISSLEEKITSEAVIKFKELRQEFDFENIIGSSKKLYETLKLTSKVAATDVSVLILGENGTGKDLLARAIHNNSKRKEGPFVAINCGAIPSDLLESELFGYESGAFTGATKSKPGKLEAADGGTVFFDEIGELSLNLQAKLLRIIQTKEIERLGGVGTKKIDVRFIAATNKDLTQMITDKLFREDLYYRLKVIEVKMPSLKERKEDIEELAEFFLQKHSSQNSLLTLSNEALEVIEDYDWPGNIRELENVIQRCIVLSKGSIIETSDLPPEIIEQNESEPRIKTGKTLLDAETDFRRMYIIKTLRLAKTKSEAAELLGINRTHFYKMLSQLGIKY